MDKKKTIRIRYDEFDELGELNLGTIETGTNRCDYNVTLTLSEEVRVDKETAEEAGIKVGLKGLEASLKETISTTLGYSTGKQLAQSLSRKISAKKCYNIYVYYRENVRKAIGLIEKYKGIFRKE